MPCDVRYRIRKRPEGGPVVAWLLAVQYLLGVGLVLVFLSCNFHLCVSAIVGGSLGMLVNTWKRRRRRSQGEHLHWWWSRFLFSVWQRTRWFVFSVWQREQGDFSSQCDKEKAISLLSVTKNKAISLLSVTKNKAISLLGVTKKSRREHFRRWSRFPGLTKKCNNKKCRLVPLVAVTWLTVTVILQFFSSSSSSPAKPSMS